MASPNSGNWTLIFGSLLSIFFVAQACNSIPQGMSEYQRTQLQLQQQHLENEAANRAAAAGASTAKNISQILSKTYDYSGGVNQARCVTGFDSMGRVVTECAQQ